MPGQKVEVGSDGLPVLLQGTWSRDKLYFVSYFSSLFNGGMKNRWPIRAYVDLFAGPGLCKDRDRGTEFPGSPLIALDCKTPFTHLFFNDINEEFVDALYERQKRLKPEANVTYLSHDCNHAAKKFADRLPRGALTLAFIDPWNFELKFEGLAHLGKRQATDLIVTFHTSSIKRNAHHQLAAVNAFLNDQNWKSRYIESQSNSSRPPNLVLVDTLRSSLKSELQYTHFGEPMSIKNSSGVPIFYLLFASKHARGLDFWEKSSAKLRSGQRAML